MGVSSDAILAYGIDFGDCDPLGDTAAEMSDIFEDDYIDFEEWYVWRYHDLAPPKAEDYGYDESQFDDLPYEKREKVVLKHYEECGFREAWREYRSKRKELEIPLKLIHHCSDSHVMYFLTLEGKDYLAYRGYPKVIDINELTVEESEKELIVKVANDMCAYSYEEDQEKVKNSPVDWHLLSWMG